jgi:hypothetical protein
MSIPGKPNKNSSNQNAASASKNNMILWDANANENFWEKVSKHVNDLLSCQKLAKRFPLQFDTNQMFAQIASYFIKESNKTSKPK